MTCTSEGSGVELPLRLHCVTRMHLCGAVTLVKSHMYGHSNMHAARAVLKFACAVAKLPPSCLRIRLHCRLMRDLCSNPPSIGPATATSTLSCGLLQSCYINCNLSQPGHTSECSTGSTGTAARTPCSPVYDLVDAACMQCKGHRGGR